MLPLHLYSKQPPTRIHLVYTLLESSSVLQHGHFATVNWRTSSIESAANDTVPRCSRLNTCNNNTILLVTLQCYYNIISVAVTTTQYCWLHCSVTTTSSLSLELASRRAKRWDWEHFLAVTENTAFQTILVWSPHRSFFTTMSCIN